MGSKGNQVSTSQTQSYTPNPLIAGAGQQAITGAQQAAQAPFQMPVAPVAGFNPFQQTAFGETFAAQGMAQPYFGAGANYLQGSAAPVTGQDVAQYYNPMAGSVLAGLEDLYGRQMSQTTGNLTQAAGGVGADRIAVGQAELARQQGLATGTTMAGLYQPALQAAQQQKQMMAGAGYGLGQMGPAAQAAQLQGIGALGAAGAQQQQLSQAEQNALYQNQLARIAYPFQTPQYLAGITGGLAPAMGGTTQGQSTTTYPTPSPLAQGLGIGTSLLGMGGMFTGGYGGLGSIFGGGGMKGSSPMYGGMGFPMYGGTGGLYHSGGRAMADGGSTYGELAKNIYARSPFGDPYASDNPMQSGGVADDQPQGPAVPGLHVPKTGASPIPTVSLPMGAGHSGLMTGGLNLQKELPYAIGPHGMVGSYPGSGQSSSVPTEALRMAQVLGNYAYSRGGSAGGAVNPMDIGQPFQEGGSPFEDRFEGEPTDRPFGSITPVRGETPESALSGSLSAIQTQPLKQMTAPGKSAPEDYGDTEVPPMATPARYARPSGGMMGGTGATTPMALPASQMPYPDALQRDWGQQAVRSPWMSLVKAGAEIATSTGPIGSVIGKGIKAGVGELEGQRKSLQSEEDINLKAQHLYQQAQIHLDQYSRMTPYQQEEVRLREQALAQTKYSPVNLEVTDEKGQPQVVAARFNPKSGQYEDAGTGKPVSGRLIARQTGAESATSRANLAFRAAKDDPDYQSDQIGTINKWRMQQGLPPLPAGTKVPTQTDIDYVKAHPEAIDKFRKTFGVEPP